MTDEQKLCILTELYKTLTLGDTTHYTNALVNLSLAPIEKNLKLRIDTAPYIEKERKEFYKKTIESGISIIAEQIKSDILYAPNSRTQPVKLYQESHSANEQQWHTHDTAAVTPAQQR